MIRTIIKSDKNRITLELPDDLVGKMIEIIAFSIEDGKASAKDIEAKTTTIINLKDELRHFTFNSGGYVFNRDEANEYE